MRSFTKLRLGKSLPGLRAAGPMRSTPLCPPWAGDPGRCFFGVYLNLAPRQRPLPPTAACKNRNSKLKSFHLNPLGVCGVRELGKPHVLPTRTGPGYARPSRRVSGVRLVVSLFDQQLLMAEQECNRKISQCLMASESRGGHNYVASTC